jgi:toxin ParE1/3/4
VSHRVVFRPSAKRDLKNIYDYISHHAGHSTAWAYVGKIEVACNALSDFPERGTVRDDLFPGIRIIGFEGRASIAFLVDNQVVRIIRIFYGGQNFPSEWLDR